MSKKEPQNCWEFWNCKIKLECSAYENDSGKECWLIASHKCPRINQGKPGFPKVDRGFKFCWECPWFNKLNPNFENK